MLPQVFGDDVEPGARIFQLHEFLFCPERHLQDFAQAIANPNAGIEAVGCVEWIGVQCRGLGLRALGAEIIDHSAQQIGARRVFGCQIMVVVGRDKLDIGDQQRVGLALLLSNAKRWIPSVRRFSTPSCCMSQPMIDARQPTSSMRAGAPTSGPRRIRHTPNGESLFRQSRTISR